MCGNLKRPDTDKEREESLLCILYTQILWCFQIVNNSDKIQPKKLNRKIVVGFFYEKKQKSGKVGT